MGGGSTETKDAQGIVHPLPPSIFIQAAVRSNPATAQAGELPCMH